MLRNALLAGSGLAVAGFTSLAGAEFGWAASASPTTRIAYGAMHIIYPAWVANAPSPDHKNSERRYFVSVPKDWTAAACHSNYVTISIRPDPDDLLNKKLDDQIKHFLSTCPDHVELTCWHEAQSDNPLHYPANVTATNMRKVHAHMQDLCTNTPNADGGRVRYGCILTGPVGTNADWLGTDLDWYGIDIYDNPNFQLKNGNLDKSAITGRMDENLSHWQKATTGTVSVRITETNSHDNHRKNWMLWLSEWMAAHNGYRIVTFWNGKLSGNWPPSKTVLEYYKTLQSQYGA